MSRHDYSQSTVSSISETIISSKNTVENTVLSIESMPYSWEAGIINNVVTWFEVLQVVDSKEQMRSMFEKANSKFSDTVQEIGQVDSGASSKLESTVNELSKTISKISDLENLLSEYSQIFEQHVWMNKKEACIYRIKEYVNFSDKGEYNYNWDAIGGESRNVFKMVITQN